MRYRQAGLGRKVGRWCASIVAAAIVLLSSLLGLSAPAMAWASTSPIQSGYNGRCLDADLNTTAGNGTKVQLWDCNGQMQQKWRVDHVDGQVTQIVSAYNGRCLDADYWTRGRNGTKVQLWDCNGSAQQQWLYRWEGTIVNELSGICLDADFGTLGRNGTKVQLWDCNGSAQQQWFGMLPNSKRTSFEPARNSFHFVNDFQNNVQPIRTGGLCGGMSYTALDYFLAGRSIPQQDFRPAAGTTLQRYLFDRQVTSILNNYARWADVRFNPGGVRNGELYRWGLDGELKKLRSSIDQGRPVPIDLKGNTSGDHQVLAIGYDLGRYDGHSTSPWDWSGEVKILVYDPNHPGATMTLVPVPALQTYTYLEDRSASYRTYFVDMTYSPRTPPVVREPIGPADGLARELVLVAATGDDDLRGGSDNIDLTVTMKDGTNHWFPNINLGARWLSNYTEFAQVWPIVPIRPDQIHSITLRDTFSGGIGGDNWDMASLSVRVLGGGLNRPIGSSGFHRFTGSDKQLTIPIYG